MFMCDTSYMKDVLTCTHTHYEWKNEIMKVNWVLYGRHSSWVEMKCLDHPYYSYSMKRGVSGRTLFLMWDAVLVGTSLLPKSFLI